MKGEVYIVKKDDCHRYYPRNFRIGEKHRVYMEGGKIVVYYYPEDDFRYDYTTEYTAEKFKRIFYTKNEIRLLKLKEISGEPNIWQKIYQERLNFKNSLKRCKFLGDPKDEYRMQWYDYHTNEIQYWRIYEDGEDGIIVYTKENYNDYLNSTIGGIIISQRIFNGCFKDLDLKDQRKKKLNKINGLLDLQECS